MKSIKYQLKELKDKKVGLQFIHDHFLSYLVKAGIDKFDKMLEQCDDQQAKILKSVEYPLKKDGSIDWKNRV